MITKETTLTEIQKHAPACKCDHCNHGCTMGSGCLTKDDVKKLAEFLNISEEELKKKHLDEVERFNTKLHRPKLKKYPYGQCTFYDEEEKCTIHKAKPLECKISMGCKEYGEQLSIWFMLNHFVNKFDPESIRQFASYLKSGGKTIPKGELKDFIKDKKQLQKILSYEVLQ